jgi:hypothetical protein
MPTDAEKVWAAQKKADRAKADKKAAAAKKADKKDPYAVPDPYTHVPFRKPKEKAMPRFEKLYGILLELHTTTTPAPSSQKPGTFYSGPQRVVYM